MSIDLTVQVESDADDIPSSDQFERWIVCVLQDKSPSVLTVRIVDREESRQLNSDYRQKDAPTNVLSFPADTPDFVDLPLLGDIVICAPLVAEQAAEQGKPVEAHWAHLCVHGVLHLLGYDHQQENEAELMESLEAEILSRLGYPDPYQPAGAAG